MRTSMPPRIISTRRVLTSSYTLTLQTLSSCISGFEDATKLPKTRREMDLACVWAIQRMGCSIEESSVEVITKLLWLGESSLLSANPVRSNFEVSF